MCLASLFGFTHLSVSLFDILSGRSGKSGNNSFIRKGKYVVFTPEPGVKFPYCYGSMEGQHTLMYVQSFLTVLQCFLQRTGYTFNGPECPTILFYQPPKL